MWTCAKLICSEELNHQPMQTSDSAFSLVLRRNLSLGGTSMCLKETGAST